MRIISLSSMINSIHTLYKLFTSPFRISRCSRFFSNSIFLDKYLPEPSRLLQSKWLSSAPVAQLSPRVSLLYYPSASFFSLSYGKLLACITCLLFRDVFSQCGEAPPSSFLRKSMGSKSLRPSFYHYNFYLTLKLDKEFVWV